MPYYHDPIADWNEAMRAKRDKGRTPAQAASELAREKPDLRDAYIQAYNEGHGEARARDRFARRRSA